MRHESDPFFGLSSELLGELSVSEGRWTRVNPAFCTALGWAESEVRAGSFTHLLHPDDREGAVEAIAGMSATDPPMRLNARMRCKDGAYKWVSWSVTREASTGALLWVGRQPSTAYEAADELRRAHSLLDGIAKGTEDLIAAEDQDFRYVYFNEPYQREFQKLWGQKIETGTSMLEAMAPWPEEQQKARKLWARALAGETYSITMEFGPSPDKRQVYDLRFNPLYDGEGRITGAAHILRNVTARIRMQEALAESEERLKIATQAAELGIFEWKVKEDVATWENVRMYEIFGRRPEDGALSLEEFRRDYILDDDAMALEHAMETSLASGKPFKASCRIRVEEKQEPRWIEVSGSFDFNKDGQAVRMVGVVADVSERKRAEEALRRSELTFRRLAEANLAGVGVGDSYGNVLYVNDEMLRMMGYSRADFEAGRVNWAEALTPESLQDAERTLPILKRDGKCVGYEREFLRPDGGRTPFIGAAAMVTPDEDLHVSTALDLTKIRDAEAAVRHSELQFRTMSEAVPAMVWASTPEGEIFYLNQRWTEYTGQPHHDYKGFGWADTVHPEDAPGVLAQWERCRRTGEVYEGEVRYRRHDGEYRWHYFRGVPVREQDGAISAWYGTSIDIQDRKIVEEALRESEERFRRMADTAPAILWMSDEVGYCGFISRGWVEFTGQSFHDALGFGWLNAVHPEDREYSGQVFRNALSRREPFVLDHRLRRHDGVYRWVIDSGRPRYDGDGNFAGYIGSVIDMHERKVAEEELRIAHDELEQRVRERTAELEKRAGQLARLTSELSLSEQRERQRIARLLHDHLQQLLVAAKFRLEVKKRTDGKQPPPRMLEVAALLDEAIAASRSLTVELAPPIFHEGGLGAGLEWLARWMKEKHGLTVHLHLETEAADEQEEVRIVLFQSVRELLFNVAKHSGVTEAWVSLDVLDEDIQLSVADLGVGFDAESVTQTGNDSGFGLFSIGERLTLLGGRLDIISAPEEGARFRLVVPRNIQIDRTQALAAANPDGTPSTAEDAAALQQTGPENNFIRVLLVDDHKVMREGLVSLLSDEPDMEILGEAADGLQAIEQARALRPDVILMDFSMPKMNGVEATLRIRSEFPDIRIIGLSMYEEPDRATAMFQAGANAYLTKSGDATDLLAAIRGRRAQ